MSVKIVAEIGINHNGSVDIAKQLMKMAKECGCDYVKFQKRDINTVYTQEFLDSPRESPWGKTQRDQKQALEFGLDEYNEISEYSYRLDIPWFASCWDLDSLAFIDDYNPPLHKIASPMLTNIPFLEAVANLGRKTLISTGMSSWVDIDRAVDIFVDNDCPFILMHCVSEYPCPDEKVNLATIGYLREAYGEYVGYSNHSPGIESCVGAAYLGAKWIEVHITLDRAMYGSDQASSLERRGLELVVKYCKNAEKIIGNGVKTITEGEAVNAKKLRYWEEK